VTFDVEGRLPKSIGCVVTLQDALAWSGPPNSKPHSAQVQLAIGHRRAPEIASGYWAGEAEEGVGDAVLLAGHAGELRLEGVEGVAEGDEHQPFAARVSPGHGAAQEEGLDTASVIGTNSRSQRLHVPFHSDRALGPTPPR